MSIIKKIEKEIKINLEKGIILKEIYLNKLDMNKYIEELKTSIIAKKIYFVDSSTTICCNIGNVKIILKGEENE